MTSEKIKSIHDGGIGFFWINGERLQKTRRPSESGYIRLGDRNLIEVATLNENPNGAGVDPPVPRSITAATEHGGLILLSIARHRGSLAFGGGHASVHRYWARSLIAGVHPDDLRSDRVFELKLLFPSVHRWAGLTAATERFQSDKDSRLAGYSVELSSPEGLTVQLSPTLQLTIAAHWSVTGPTDRRILYTPTSIACTSTRPRPINDLRKVLSWVHGLLCLCHGGCVIADGGTAVPDCEPNGMTPTYWDTRFMVCPRSAPEPELSLPFLQLGTVGGVSALARWLRLCERHPRAVRPVIEPYAGVGRSASVRMLEVAAAIEYWINCHRRSAAWARKHSLKPLNLAESVGKHLATWVGDSKIWADLFWETYNGLKHEPGYSPDPDHVGVLAESGALLLTTALLDRIARNKMPAKVIFGDAHRTWQLRDAVQELVSNPPKKMSRRSGP